MAKLQDIPWLRVGAEIVAIVGSILLAFAIDSAWQRRLDGAQAATLVEDLIADFESSRTDLQRVLREQKSNQRLSVALLQQITEAEEGSEITISMQGAIAAIMTPTYSPATAALDLALSTGEIDLIQDQDLRNLLSLWRLSVADNAEEEQLIVEVATEQILPLLSEQLRLGSLLNDETIDDWRTGSSRFDVSVQLEIDSKLEGLLGYRVFLGDFVVPQLEGLVTQQEELLNLLNASLKE